MLRCVRDVGLCHRDFYEYWSFALSCIKIIDSKKFQKELVNNLPKCEVCIRGGMMLSQIRLGNELHCNIDNIHKGDFKIIKGFSMDSFYKMEEEYEHSTYKHPYERHTSWKLANICCNVLVNGDFNTEDKTDYLIN